MVLNPEKNMPIKQKSLSRVLRVSDTYSFLPLLSYVFIDFYFDRLIDDFLFKKSFDRFRADVFIVF